MFVSDVSSTSSSFTEENSLVSDGVLQPAPVLLSVASMTPHTSQPLRDDSKVQLTPIQYKLLSELHLPKHSRAELENFDHRITKTSVHYDAELRTKFVSVIS